MRHFRQRSCSKYLFYAIVFDVAGNQVSSKSAGSALEIKTPITITGITLDRTELAMLVSQEVTLNPTISPTNANEQLEWSSSNPNVAFVDETGKIIGNNIGTTIITVSPKNNNSVKATCEVSVLDGVTIVENGIVNNELMRRIPYNYY